MLDVYRYPSIESLALEMEARHRVCAAPGQGSQPDGEKNIAPANKSTASPPEAGSGGPSPFWRHFLCGAAQAFALVFVLSFYALQWLTPYLTYTVLVEEEYDFLEATLGAFASLILFYPFMVVIPIAVKWLVIGRYRRTYPLWGFYYFRWWLVTTVESAVPVGYMAGTPWLNIYLRLMGAHIGRDVFIDTSSFAIYDLLTIGDHSSLNVDSSLLGYSVEQGQLRIGPIDIGNRCFVGTRSALRQDTVMEDGSALEDLSLLPRGTRIPAGKTWQGSPAENREGDGATPCPAGATPCSLVRRLGFGALHGAGMLLFPVLVAAALFPGIVLMNELNYLDPYYWYLLAGAAGRRVVHRAFPGPGDRGGQMAAAGEGETRAPTRCTASTTCASGLWTRPWTSAWTSLARSTPSSIWRRGIRLLGARLGYGAEISTASFISPDLLSIGDESFIADSVSLGAPRVRDGAMTLGLNHIGKRSFIGNSALLPPGTIIGDRVLIGCLSAPPAHPADALRENSTWMGSPSLLSAATTGRHRLPG